MASELPGYSFGSGIETGPAPKMNSQARRSKRPTGSALGKMRWFPSRFIFAFVMAAVAGRAQNMFSTVTQELDRAGFGLYDISVFGGYTASRTPAFDPSGALISDYGFHSIIGGASASIGWRTRKSDTWHLVIRYNPSYYYQDSSTGFHRSRFMPNQNLMLNWSKPIATKWTLGASLSVAAGQYNQLLLLSDPSQILAGSPGTPGQLAGAVLTGAGTNANLNATATGANATIAGQQNLLYGNRFITGTGQVHLGYQANERLNVSGSFGVSRMQHLNDSVDPTPYLLTQSTYLNGSLGMGYLLSPRTNIFASIGYSRGLSSIADTPSANLNFGVGRTVTDHLFVRGSAGLGYILPGGQGHSFQRTNWQAAAGVGYRILRQSFVGSVSRTVADSFGLGADATIVASAGWNWHPVSGRWGLTAGGAEQRFTQTVYGRQGYRVMGGVYTMLKERISMNLSYGYGSGTSALLTASNTPTIPYNSISHSIRLTIGWSPYFGKPDPDNPFPGGQFPGQFPGGGQFPGVP